MNAIILAAGLGSRFKDITQSTHKSLLDIHGTPNLERTLTFLRQANIDNIVIVTGYLHEQFEYLKKKYDCTLIYNEKYREYNSIYSFSLAQDFFNDCYVIDADVVLNRNIFLTKPSHSKYFTVIRSKTHNEWLPILNSNGQVIRIEIGSLNQPSLSGVSYWTTRDCDIILTLLKEYTSEVRLKNPKLYWDTIPMEYIEKLNIYTEQLNSDDIFEMDNLDDYHHILQKLTPNKEK